MEEHYDLKQDTEHLKFGVSHLKHWLYSLLEKLHQKFTSGPTSWITTKMWFLDHIKVVNINSNLPHLLFMFKRRTFTSVLISKSIHITVYEWELNIFTNDRTTCHKKKLVTWSIYLPGYVKMSYYITDLNLLVLWRNYHLERVHSENLVLSDFDPLLNMF